MARSALLLLAYRGATILGGLLFAAVVPRLMGPATYGRYALMTSLAVWLVLLGGLGMANVLVRQMPVLAGSNPARLDALLGNLLALRLVSGTVISLVYVAVTTVWLGDLPFGALVILAACVFVQTTTNFMFATFLGFNQPGRWAASEGLYRWLSLALIVPAFSLGGLTAACAALLAANTILLTLGAWWSRSWLTRIDFGPDLRSLIPYLRIGLVFYATQVLFTILLASGEPMVRIFSGDYVEVGYFALAHNMYLAGTTALSQLTMVFVPVLSARRAGGDEAGVTRWLARLRTWLVSGGVVVLFASLLLGDALVALVLGPVFAPVAANLPPLAVALLILTFTSATSTLALVHDRPRPMVIASSLRLLAFWSVGPLLVAGYGAWGACLAVVLAAGAHSACLGWLMRRALGGELGAPVKAVALGALFVPLVWLRGSAAADLLLFVTFTAAYGALLLRCGILKTAELRTLVDTVRVSVANGRGSPAPAVL